MHDPVTVHPAQSEPETADSMSAVEALAVTPNPVPVSPVGFTTLSGLVGLAFGVILAPYIERFNRRRQTPASKDDQEDGEE
jgi:hypothetical protein